MSGTGLSNETLHLPKNAKLKPPQTGHSKVIRVKRENPNSRSKSMVKSTEGGSQNKQENIPHALLNTWYWMWRFGEEKSLAEQSKSKLIAYFGSLEKARSYFEK